MTAVVTVLETGWGILRRGALGDLAGLQVAVALVLLLAFASDPTRPCWLRPAAWRGWRAIAGR